MFPNEQAEVDRRAASAGMSRAAYVRKVLLADGDACAVLRATVAEREEWIERIEQDARERERCLGARIASLEFELERARLQAARAGGWERSDVFERRRQAQEHFYG
jgi:hypothetical protein